jgi:hypothetical protein
MWGEEITQLEIHHVAAGRCYTASVAAPSDVFRRREDELLAIVDALRLTGAGNRADGSRALGPLVVAGLSALP